MTTTLPALSPDAQRLLLDTAREMDGHCVNVAIVPLPETRIAVADELHRAGLIYGSFERGLLWIQVTERGEAYLDHPLSGLTFAPCAPSLNVVE